MDNTVNIAGLYSGYGLMSLSKVNNVFCSDEDCVHFYFYIIIYEINNWFVNVLLYLINLFFILIYKY